MIGHPDPLVEVTWDLGENDDDPILQRFDFARVNSNELANAGEIPGGAFLVGIVVATNANTFLRPLPTELWIRIQIG
jgi:hypothetical protein